MTLDDVVLPNIVGQKIQFVENPSKNWNSSKSGVLKLRTSTKLLIYFGVLKLDVGNQIWKFLCRYFGKFLVIFPDI